MHRRCPMLGEGLLEIEEHPVAAQGPHPRRGDRREQGAASRHRRLGRPPRRLDRIRLPDPRDGRAAQSSVTRPYSGRRGGRSLVSRRSRCSRDATREGSSAGGSRGSPRRVRSATSTRATWRSREGIRRPAERACPPRWIRRLAGVGGGAPPVPRAVEPPCQRLRAVGLDVSDGPARVAADREPSLPGLCAAAASSCHAARRSQRVAPLHLRFSAVASSSRDRAFGRCRTVLLSGAAWYRSVNRRSPCFLATRAVAWLASSIEQHLRVPQLLPLRRLDPSVVRQLSRPPHILHRVAQVVRVLLDS